MAIVVVTGTGTEVGKTVATAAVAAASLAQGLSVAVLKPAQTGVAEHEPGDAAEVARLAGPVTAAELARYPEPLAPVTAALRSGRNPVGPEEIAEAAAKLAAVHDVVLVEGAGGLLVRYDEKGSTLADTAALMGARVLLVAPAGLGTLNATALTAEALAARKVICLGVIIGSWAPDPGLAERCNIADLPVAANAPLLGALPERAAALSPAAFRAAAADWLAPELGGRWDAQAFAAHYAPAPYAPAPEAAPTPDPSPAPEVSAAPYDPTPQQPPAGTAPYGSEPQQQPGGATERYGSVPPQPGESIPPHASHPQQPGGSTAAYGSDSQQQPGGEASPYPSDSRQPGGQATPYASADQPAPGLPAQGEPGGTDAPAGGVPAQAPPMPGDRFSR
ncbi:ATP-dependent dethiobiotin synthetase BioD [Streptomyces sp. KK5PA1]|uniref:ATP-dependent dethiobiotin synthetase BioD n=1 Tax=Actinacidiphila acididurans TaxID=2784346 RepID=A0ABS2U1T6_9ACTN|nr:ATP-dependent dethiobiotin synthetase BioD [Actinacidiphila acididurans]